MSYNLYDYNIRISYDEADNDYIAAVEEIPGISAFDDTPEKALEQLKVVFDEFLDIQKEDGDAIPTPLREYSGNISVRGPRSLHKALAERARQESVSLNQLIIYLLSSGLKKPV